MLDLANIKDRAVTQYKLQNVQPPPSRQLRGLRVSVLESSHGWLAATVVSYCPCRTSELQPIVITKHSD